MSRRHSSPDFFFSRLHRGYGQYEGKCTSFALSAAFHAHQPAMNLGQLFNNAKAKPKTAVRPSSRRVGLSEAVENVWKKGWVDSFARIRDAEFEMGVYAFNNDLNIATARCEFDGVCQQIPDDLPESCRVS